MAKEYSTTDNVDMRVPITHLWVEIRHAPGYSDDGVWNVWHEKVEAVKASEGINGKVGTWTSVHAVFFDPTPVDDGEGR